jgi:hypothetical protein
VKRWVQRILLGILVAAVAVWAGDWMVWRVRGATVGTVDVTWFQVAELKGSKEDFYPDGEGPVRCSVSALPEGGMNPCWWVRRHPVVFER